MSDKPLVVGGVYGNPCSEKRPCYLLIRIDREKYCFLIFSEGTPAYGTEEIFDPFEPRYTDLLSEQAAKRMLNVIGDYLGKIVINSNGYLMIKKDLND